MNKEHIWLTRFILLFVLVILIKCMFLTKPCCVGDGQTGTLPDTITPAGNDTITPAGNDTITPAGNDSIKISHGPGAPQYRYIPATGLKLLRPH